MQGKKSAPQLPRNKLQHPSSKHQRNTKHQIPNPKLKSQKIPTSKSQTSILGPSFGICNFGIFLGFGPWCSRGFPWIFLRNPTGETFLTCPDYTPSASLLRSLPVPSRPKSRLL